MSAVIVGSVAHLHQLEAERDRIEGDLERTRRRLHSLTTHSNTVRVQGIVAGQLRQEVAELERRFARVDAQIVREVWDGRELYEQAFAGVGL